MTGRPKGYFLTSRLPVSLLGPQRQQRIHLQRAPPWNKARASAAIATNTDTPAKTIGSRAETPNSNPLMNCAPANRQRGANDKPDHHQHRAFAQHEAMTSPGDAPSATRRPISGTR